PSGTRTVRFASGASTSAPAECAAGMANSLSSDISSVYQCLVVEVGMAWIPDRADIVVIGAGIVGDSVVRHLADHGWRDSVMVDKGPLPDPGGSTGHASNFVFPVDHSRQITQRTVDSMLQYAELDALI